MLDGLDHRERGGFERVKVELRFRTPDPGPVRGLVYVASSSNSNYLGPAPLAAIAEQVRRSHGPSGANAEYVLRLARALRDLEAHDEHVFAVADLLRNGGAS